MGLRVRESTRELNSYTTSTMQPLPPGSSAIITSTYLSDKLALGSSQEEGQGPTVPSLDSSVVPLLPECRDSKLWLHWVSCWLGR